MLNKEVVRLESVVKSDSSVEQMVYFVQGSREGVEPRFREGCSRFHSRQGRLYGVLCLRGGLLGEESHIG